MKIIVRRFISFIFALNLANFDDQSQFSGTNVTGMRHSTNEVKAAPHGTVGAPISFGDKKENADG